MKLAIVVGVRPHFIKLSALLPALKTLHEVYVIHTGQHFAFEMSQVFFRDLFEAEPDYNLGVGAGSHAKQTGDAMIGIETILQRRPPDLLLVIGDANPSLAGAIAAAKLNIPVVHVEAGLMSNLRSMPEEVNRRVVDSIASIFLCPTVSALNSLCNRGISSGLHFTGDLLLDCVKNNIDRSDRESHALQQLKLSDRSYILATVHRVENTSSLQHLQNIVHVLCAATEQVVFCVHPRTRNALLEARLIERLEHAEHVTITQPQSYLDMLALTKHARLVLTDSNGLQREAYFVRTPCLILRDATEFPETVDAGCASIVHTDTDKILPYLVTQRWPHSEDYDTDLFGKGDSAVRMATVLSGATG